MTMRTLIGALGFAVLVTAAIPTRAAGGKIEVRLRDKKGRAVMGNVTARSGEKKKSCTTRAGTCTIERLEKGEWIVRAKTKSGNKSGKRIVKIKDSKSSISFTLTIQEKEKNARSAKVKKDAKAADKTKKQARSLKLSAQKKSAAQSDKSEGQAKSASKIKNLGTGKKKSVTGTVRDSSGRALLGTITVKDGKKVIGESKTAAGRFKVYDLPEGTYTILFKTKSGKSAERTVKCVAGKEISVNLKVE